MCNAERFEIIDSTSSLYRRKLKEAMHIAWEEIINKEKGKTRKYFYNYLITFCFSPFYLFYYYYYYYYYCYYYYRYCNHVVLTPVKISFLFVKIICYHSDCVNILGFYFKWFSRFLIQRFIRNGFRKKNNL